MHRAICTAVIGLGLAGGIAADSHGPEQVQVDTGLLAGVLQDDVVVFRGVPFAAPPVGESRWRPPQPVEPWTGVRDATEFGHACPQPLGPYPEWADNHFTAVGIDEDCLTLNVWAPADRVGEPLPVMVYIHGGNMQYGSCWSRSITGWVTSAVSRIRP